MSKQSAGRSRRRAARQLLAAKAARSATLSIPVAKEEPEVPPVTTIARPSKLRRAGSVAILVVVGAAFLTHGAALIASQWLPSAAEPTFSLSPVDANAYKGAQATDMTVEIERPTITESLGRQYEVRVQMTTEVPAVDRVTKLSDYDWRLQLPDGATEFSVPLYPKGPLSEGLEKRPNAFGKPVETLDLAPNYIGLWAKPPLHKTWIDVATQTYLFDRFPGTTATHYDVHVVSVEFMMKTPIVSHQAPFSGASERVEIGWQWPNEVPAFRGVEVPNADFQDYDWGTNVSGIKLDQSKNSVVAVEACATCSSHPADANFDNSDLKHTTARIAFGDSQSFGWTIPWRPWNWLLPLTDWIAISCAALYFGNAALGFAVAGLRKPIPDKE